MRSSLSVRVLPVAAATVVLTAFLSACGDGGNSQALSTVAVHSLERATETTTGPGDEPETSSATTTRRGPDTPVDPADYERAGMSIFTYQVGDVVGDCAISTHGATCEGGTPRDAPMVTARPLPPRQADAIYIGRDGMHWTVFEDVGPSQGSLSPGQSIQVGAAKCRYPDDETLQCTSGGDSFTVTAPDGEISISGTLVDTPVWDLPDYY